MSDDDTCTVRGVIAFPPGAAPPQGATVVVAVEDVSRADARSEVVAETRVQAETGADEGAGQGEVAFHMRVPGEMIRPGGRYAVRAHVDTTGSGDVTEGDYVSTVSYPVLQDGPGSLDEVRVEVRSV